MKLVEKESLGQVPLGMTRIIIVPISLLLVSSASLACMTGGTKFASKSQIEKVLPNKRKPAAEISAFADSAKNPSLEAKLGNLLVANSSKTAVISIPAAIKKSSYHPFGDGQSNAKLTLGLHWKENDFLVVGIEDLKDSASATRTRKYIFHPSLKVQDYKEAPLGNGWYKVTPKGWNDHFYFSFDTATMGLQDFLKEVPLANRTFSKNRTAPNIAKIGKGSGSAGFTNLGEGYNPNPWYADSVHGRFPDANGEKTAIGGVLTWGIVDRAFGPFKNLYTCFEPRNLAEEKTTGSPSGAGWHHIGDPAESILNNLENLPLPVATARTHSFQQTAYGLTDSITATWLQSDEVLVSTKDTFHWYLNPYEASVCTEIWVHNCVPNASNSRGFNCP